MPYLIFNDKKFMGFSLEKKLVKSLLKERGRIFNVHEVDIFDIFEIKDIHNYQLHWHSDYKRTLFNHEVVSSHSIAAVRIVELHTAYVDYKRFSQFVKFTDEEKETMDSFCLFIERMIDDLYDPGESCVTYDDYMDIKGILDILIGKKQ